ncbi:MAG: hypothetical protein IBX69_07430 [Anaerolineales bacterium]|nr:hypothetical protein [Anaerolineales bacterium]
MKTSMSKLFKGFSKLSFMLGSVSLIVGLVLSAVHTPALAEDIDPGPPTTTLNVQPIGVPANPACQDLLPPGSFLYEFKHEPVASGTYPLEFNGLTGSVTIEVYTHNLGEAFDFSFAGDFVSSAIIVKGGPNANFYDYRPFNGAELDTFLHAPVNQSNNQFFGLSHISFCLIEKPAPTPTSTPEPTDTPTFTPEPTDTPTFTPTPEDPTPTPVEPSPTPVEPSPTPVEPSPTNTLPPSPIIDTPTPTEEQPQPSPEPTTTDEPPGPPAVTATNTQPATLAPPQQPATTPVLIPVTGTDLSADYSQADLLQQIFINLGIGLLGLAFVFYGFSYKFGVN